jgi:hypothetical protein
MHALPATELNAGLHTDACVAAQATYTLHTHSTHTAKAPSNAATCPSYTPIAASANEGLFAKGKDWIVILILIGMPSTPTPFHLTMPSGLSQAGLGRAGLGWGRALDN